MMISDLTWTKRRRLLGATVIGLVLIAGLTVLGNIGGTAKAAILTPIAGPEGGETLFYDDFSGDLSQWTIQSGTWAIETGELDTSGDNAIIFASAEVEDAVMEAKVKLIDKKEDAHLIMRAQDKDNFYFFGLAPWNYKWGIAKRVAGSWISIACSGADTELELGITYKLRAEIQASQLKLYVDDHLAASGIDNAFSYGKVGLMAWNLGDVHFDDVKVNAITIPSAYSLNVRAGVTQIVVTCTWRGSGNITIANLTRSPTEVYYESNMSMYERTTVSVDGTTSIFNIRRAVLSIAVTTSSETWTLYLNLTDVTSCQVSVETS